MIRRSLLAGAIALLVVPAVAGCEAGLNAPTLEFHQASNGAHGTVDGITISNVFVLAAPSGSSVPAGSPAGLFLGLFNNGSTADTLVSVSTSAASTATITGGPVTVPPNSGVNLTGPQPKVVLTGLAKPLRGGQNVEVTLTFQDAGQVRLDVPVEPQSYYYSSLAQPSAVTPSAGPSATVVAPGATPTAGATATPAATATATPSQ